MSHAPASQVTPPVAEKSFTVGEIKGRNPSG
jgi:hypothetical protein